MGEPVEVDGILQESRQATGRQHPRNSPMVLADKWTNHECYDEPVAVAGNRWRFGSWVRIVGRDCLGPLGLP